MCFIHFCVGSCLHVVGHQVWICFRKSPYQDLPRCEHPENSKIFVETDEVFPWKVKVFFRSEMKLRHQAQLAALPSFHVVGPPSFAFNRSMCFSKNTWTCRRGAAGFQVFMRKFRHEAHLSFHVFGGEV
jgi:hypothetical protein